MNKPINFKKAVKEPAIPNKILIILSNPRSGSTWLLDAMRCHPAVEMLISGIIYTKLGLVGRRYPRDLSGRKKGSTHIEVRPDMQKKDWVPIFSISDKSYRIPDEILKKPYAIEKIHPHFFQQDVKNFLNNINTLFPQNNIKFIYLVRDPEQTFRSYLAYQERNPNWNSGRTQADVVSHMEKTYQSIRESAELRPGLIIDYQDMVGDFSGSMLKIFEHLWPGYTSMKIGDTELFLADIFTETKRESRKSSPVFFRTAIERNASKYDEDHSFFNVYKKNIDNCIDLYQTILDNKQI